MFRMLNLKGPERNVSAQPAAFNVNADAIYGINADAIYGITAESDRLYPFRSKGSVAFPFGDGSFAGHLRCCERPGNCPVGCFQRKPGMASAASAAVG